MKKNKRLKKFFERPPVSVTRSVGKAYRHRRSRSCVDQNLFKPFVFLQKINPVYVVLSFFVFSGCQSPTQITEYNMGQESRLFSKIGYGAPAELKRSVIIDVRSQFEHQMSHPPRSFYAYWKDWDLRGLEGNELKKKTTELQNLLAVHGIDPLTQVVILGKALKGQGEEFLLATTLISLGIERIQLISEQQAKRALAANKKLPKVESLPYWSKPLKDNFNCAHQQSSDMATLMKKADVVISNKFMEKGGAASRFFKNDLKLKEYKFPKTLRVNVYSPGSLWAYGIALYLKNQGRQACVL